MNTKYLYIMVILLICYKVSASTKQQQILSSYSGQSKIEIRDTFVIKDGFVVSYRRNVRIYNGASFGSMILLVSQADTANIYKPLVSTTSLPCPKETVCYKSDNFQRLPTIKDQNGHTVNSYVYHFKP